MSENDKTGLGYDSQLSKNEMPKCEIFEPASDSSVNEIDEDNNQVKDSINYLIKDCTFHKNKKIEKSVVNNKGKGTGQREVRLVWNNARKVNHQNFSKMTHPHPKRNFVPTAVATKLRQVLVNAAKQNSATSTSTARPKNFSKMTHPYPKRNFVPTAVATKSRQVLVNAAKQNSATSTSTARPKVNHQNFSKMTHPHPKRNFVPTAVATKLRQVLVNAAKQNSATSTSTARPKVNTAAIKPNVNAKSSYFKPHFPKRRHFNQKSATKTNSFSRKINTSKGKNVTTVRPKSIVNAAEGKKENAVKSSACWIWRPKGKLIDHTLKDNGSYTLKRFNYVDPNEKLKSVMAWVPKRN
nr:hypothetical protein [Tanacetum cinerariifolium]